MASKSDISRWFDEGVHRRATHLIVVCDTFDMEDYPIYCTSDADCITSYRFYETANLQKVVEVYDLRMDKISQIQKDKTFNLPLKNEVPIGQESEVY